MHIGQKARFSLAPPVDPCYIKDGRAALGEGLFGLLRESSLKLPIIDGCVAEEAVHTMITPLTSIVLSFIMTVHHFCEQSSSYCSHHNFRSNKLLRLFYKNR